VVQWFGGGRRGFGMIGPLVREVEEWRVLEEGDGEVWD
jgi:hypothetical protein